MTVDWKDVLGWTGEQVNDLRLTGYSYLRQGLYERAAIFFEALISLEPDNAFDHQTLGALYLQAGDGRRAIQMLDRALELEPGHGPSLLNKAKALLLLGERELGLKLARDLASREELSLRNLAEALVIAYA